MYHRAIGGTSGSGRTDPRENSVREGTEIKNSEKRIAELEEVVQAQQKMIRMLIYFCEAVASKEGEVFLSYHQLYSPFPDHKEEILVLLKEIFEFTQSAVDRDRSI